MSSYLGDSPRQGHVIFSGLPGAGKTSLFLALVISLYAQLQQMEDEEQQTLQRQRSIPRVATLAINVKGADLLFLDHLDSDELEAHDHNRSINKSFGDPGQTT